MPAPGDQHKDTIHSANPFADTTPTISKYTAIEIATLQSRLEKQLGPEYISTRPGAGGGKVHYLAAEKVINLANEVFGFNGWSSSIQNVQIDFVDEHPTTGRINLGLSTIVRVTLKDGSFHEDIGYGHCENVKGKAAAFEKAKKEAATDAMKRALRNFGNVLGNCLYDKDYLSRITKVKVQPSKWDAGDLHRHRDFQVKKEVTSDDERQAQPRQTNGNSNGDGSAIRRNTSVQSAASYGSAEFEDDFGGDFDDTDFSHPDEVRVDDSTVTNAGERSGQQQRQQPPQQPQELRPVNIQAPTPMQGMQAPQRPQNVQRPPNNAAQRPQNPTRMGPPQTPAPPPARYQQQMSNANANAAPQQQSTTETRSSSSSEDSSHTLDNRPQPPQAPPPGAPIGFVTGRKADLVNAPTGAAATSEGLAFNPHAESPSIRRTQGVNPGKSAPITREVLKAAKEGHPLPQQPIPLQQPQAAARPAPINYTNPSADMSRKIGMPQSPVGGGFSGGRGSGAYRPHTSHGVKRSALGDVTNIAQNQRLDGASDLKKPKIDAAGKPEGEVQ